MAISLAGKSHIRSGRLNQDGALAWVVGCGAPAMAGTAAERLTPDDINVALASIANLDGLRGVPILALSDGHGGAAYDLSHVGSSLAVRVGAVAMGSIGQDAIVDGAVSSTWMTELPRRLVQQWRRLVLERQDPDGIGPADQHVSRFGSTFLGAVVGTGAGLYVQLGDGDLVIVDREARVHRPTPFDREPMGTETDSLCHDDAVARVRVGRSSIPGEEISLVMLSSDGISNSFVDDAGFEDFVRDVARMSSTMSPTQFRTQLFRWMASCTSFSADDVSIALAIRKRPGHPASREEI